MISEPVAVNDTAPYTSFTRAEWKKLAEHTPLPLTEDDISRIASLGDPIDMDEVDSIYRPLSAFLQLHVDGQRRTARDRAAFLKRTRHTDIPFVIGIAGSVAVGKSTVARLLQLLLSRWQGTPRVDLVTTDGFLLPNSVLEERGILDRKGFPESYDRQALLDFLARVKAGHRHLEVPVYSHVIYDIVPSEKLYIDRPDILIVEGVNVLQPPRAAPDGSGVAVSDYFDFSIYVDADEVLTERWFIDRFLTLRSTVFSRPDSFFLAYADLTDEEAETAARDVWTSINLPNLRENIAPTRPRASMILTKGNNHLVEQISLRKQ